MSANSTSMSPYSGTWMSSGAVRKWQQLGPGMEILGKTLACDATNLKWSSIGWSSGKSSLPVIVG